jgi:hypothetical protein
MESQGLLKKCLNYLLFFLYGLAHTGANAFSLAMSMMAILVGSEATIALMAGELRAAGMLSAMAVGTGTIGFAAGALYRLLDGSTAWTRSKLSTIGLFGLSIAGIIIVTPFFIDANLPSHYGRVFAAGAVTALLAVWGIDRLCRHLHGVSLLTVWKDGLQEAKGMFKKNSSRS